MKWSEKRGLMAALMLMMAPVLAQANNGHFMVDHAVIADPGSCQLETWLSRDDGLGSNTLEAVPACTTAAGWQVAVPVQYHMSDSELSGFGLEAKTILGSARNFGAIAMTLGTHYDRSTDRLERTYVNIPWSADVGNNMTWHLNVGMAHQRANSNFYTNWGGASTFHYRDNVDLVLEAAAFGSDSPSVAGGARFHLQQGWEIDVSIGRDTETRRDFANIGFNIRF